MIDTVAVQMCARKISAIAGDARAAIEVCRRAVEAVETDCRQQLRLQANTSNILLFSLV
jgi:cell division control protein 6